MELDERTNDLLRAKPSWLSFNVSSGTGNKSVNATATAHTGRSVRTGVITIKAGSLTKTVNVTQNGSNIFTVDADTLSFTKEGGVKAFTGTSNSNTITYSVKEDASSWLTAGKVTVMDETYDSGQTIGRDPGAQASYKYSIAFTAKPNTTVSSRSGKITVARTDYTVTQAAGDATLTVTPATLTFESTGGTKAITITSNTTWSIS